MVGLIEFLFSEHPRRLKVTLYDTLDLVLKADADVARELAKLVVELKDQLVIQSGKNTEKPPRISL